MLLSSRNTRNAFWRWMFLTTAAWRGLFLLQGIVDFRFSPLSALDEARSRRYDLLVYIRIDFFRDSDVSPATRAVTLALLGETPVVEG